MFELSWNATAQLGPEAANVPLLDVGGQNNFGGYINYLTAFGIPWVIIADGPALRGTSALAKQFAKQRLRPPTRRTTWTTSVPGVTTGRRQACSPSPTSWRRPQQVRRIGGVPGTPGSPGPRAGPEGHHSKPRVGALFAARYPLGPPPEVAALYEKVTAHLSLG